MRTLFIGCIHIILLFVISTIPTGCVEIIPTKNPSCNTDFDCPQDWICATSGPQGTKSCQRKNDKLVCSPRCETGTICTQGKCVAVQRCNPSCANGSTCQNGRCVASCNPPCKADHICRSGSCVPKPACEKDVDCPIGQVCKSGSCRATGIVECKENLDCTNGTKCENGKCIPAPCNPACQNGSRCVHGICTAIPSKCDPKCPPEQKCYQGACMQCAQDLDCPKGQVCQRGHCVTKPGCTPSCKPGEQCIANKCIPVNSCRPPCQSSHTCENGRCVPIKCSPPCHSSQRCENGKCIDKRPSCRTTAECPAGHVCHNGICQTNGILAKTGERCSQNRRCVQGNICVRVSQQGNFCFQTCQTDRNCASNKLKTHCRRLSQQHGICVQLSKPGEPCGYNEKMQAMCTSGSVCKNGICVESKPAGIGSPCSGDQPCQQGSVCITVEANKSYCFQSCKDKSDCASNSRKKTCFQIGRSGKVCLQDMVPEGGKCGLGGTTQALCSPNLLCKNGTCQGSKTVADGEQCDDSTRQCGAQSTCVKFSQGAKTGYCLKQCTSDTDCTSGTCQLASAQGKVCMPTGSGEDHDICQPSGPKLNPKQLCKKGLNCVAFSPPLCLNF